MKKIAFLSLLILVTAQLFGSYYFYVQLKDKNNSPFSLKTPSAFLSERALERRNFYNISVDSTDFPVNPQYINQISDLGIYIHCTTKWLNGVTVLLSDSSKIAPVRLLPFVKFVQFTGITNENQANLAPERVSPAPTYDYGAAKAQIEQLNGVALHKRGYKGDGIHIAVLDAGFRGVNTNPAFNTMRNENRFLGTKDFVNPASNIYAEDMHGAYVLSTMAGEIDGTFVGTAPKASYLLIRTEAAIGEYLCEPDFWVSGIEYADSLGIDLATTSLGYTTFDDPAMNYTYSNLDGKTARASIAATMAFKKGIFLLNSAGNEGNKIWKYVSVPADAEGVLTIGSVTKDSIYSSFSSIGPTFDGRQKPELCALGTSSSLLNPTGTAIYGSGTSFATPIMAGLAACYLQAAKDKIPSHTLDELKENLFKSAHLYTAPTPKLGYGIPNFEILVNDLKRTRAFNYFGKNGMKIYINANTQLLKIQLSETDPSTGVARLFALTGQLIRKQSFNSSVIQMDVEAQETGIYILNISEK